MAHVFGAGGATHVASAQAAGQYFFDGGHDGGSRLGTAQVVQHHGPGPDLADGVGDALAIDVRCRAVDGLEHGREFALGIQVRAGGNGDGARAGGAEVRKDVPE